MSAARIIKSMGVSVSLADGEHIKLSGLNSLDPEIASRVLEVARAQKDEILAELRKESLETSAHEAELDRFFSVAVEHAFPDGTVGWVDPRIVHHLTVNPEACD